MENSRRSFQSSVRSRRVWAGQAMHWAKGLTAAVVITLMCITQGAFAAPQQSPGAPASSEGPAASEANLSEATDISPEQAAALQKEMLQAVQSDAFRYRPLGLADPFVPFIEPQTTVTETYPEAEREPSPVSSAEFPLTPLQRMTLAELERGLKAIVWGELGSRALIQDASGKGYIVQEGTPVTPDGLVERIYKDAVVVRQYVWNADQKQWVPDFVTVQLRKEEEK
ncbi:hypothetical protein [Desulfosoma sp.]|uniref:hypothetical protein n=1 Tax=Desulfosoma sp. TaxID=2603217 RepID=UPI00404B0743